MEYPCIKCGSEVRPRQHAIACDACGKWQHRTCSTGISAAAYRQAVRDGSSLSFVCQPCTEQIPPLEVLDNQDDDDDAAEDNVSGEPSGPNHSVHIDTPYEEPQVIANRSLQDPLPSEHSIPDQPLDFELVRGASQKGKDLLIDSHGYSYNLKETRGQVRIWRCSVRNSSMKCTAGVRERDSTFFRNKIQHIHAPEPTKCMTAKVMKEAKLMAEKDMFRAARAIVKDAQTTVGRAPAVEPINEDYLVRATNRHRQQMRPEEPKDLHFELDHSTIPPDFFRRELVTSEGRRHLIFASEEQLDLLRDAPRWYLDATFKVVRPPFVQMFSIHAFVRRGDHSKQVPLMFVMMSGRKAIDYITVFEKVKRAVRPTQLQGFVLDFERAMWKAIRETFPTAKIQGCFFHWAQAVWKKVKALGLQTEYLEHRGSYCFVRQVMCLPFLPAEHIPPTFEALTAFNSADHLVPLLDYIQSTWMESTIWDVSEWSVFGQSVRTNNDVEGWHRRLNQRAGDSPPFYVLLNVLHGEAEDAVNQVMLVSELSLRRLQRKKYTSMQAKVFAAWDSYRDGMSATALLKQISTLYKHRVIADTQED